MEKDFNIIDRFLYKFIICLVLLVTLLLLGKANIVDVDKIRDKMKDNINMLKVLKFVNGEEGVFVDLDINDEVVLSVSQKYQNYEEINGGKRVFLNDMEGVEVYKTGIVVKIYKNNDNTYEVTIKGIDDIEYIYNNLESVNVNIYKIVKSGETIGSPKTSGKKNYFDFFEVKYL